MTTDIKDSGVNWIGTIPGEWEINKIKYTAIEENSLFLDGDWIESDVIEDEGIRYFTTGNIGTGLFKEQGDGYISPKTFEELHCLKVYPGDLAISRLNEPIGRACFIPDGQEYYVVSVDVVILRPDSNYDKRYLVYAMNSDGYREHANLIARGATMQRISRSQLGQFFIPVPSFKEQCAIADYLDVECAKIDGIIDDLESQIDILRSHKKSLVTEAVTKGIRDNAEMIDSGTWLGCIPVGWEISKVKYLVDDKHPYPIGDGDHGMIKADDYLSDGIPYIRVLNLTWGSGLSMDNIVYIDETMNDKIKNSELRPNDILIAKTGATIGKTAIVPDWMPRSNTTSHVGKITLPESQCPEFFYHQMNSNVIQSQILDLSAMQSTRPELGIEGLKNLIVVVPPLKEQNEIAEYLDVQCEIIDTVLQTKQQQLDKIKLYKESLIYEYITGKKRVKEVM